MIVEVWLGIVIPAQGVHNKDTTLCTVLFQEQAPILEHLEAQGRRSSVQCNHVNRSTQRLVQNDADLQRTGEHVCHRQLGCEKHGHIHVAEFMGLVPGRGAEQVNGNYIWTAVQDCADFLRKVGSVIHLVNHCILSVTSRQASAATELEY